MVVSNLTGLPSSSFERREMNCTIFKDVMEQPSEQYPPCKIKKRLQDMMVHAGKSLTADLSRS